MMVLERVSVTQNCIKICYSTITWHGRQSWHNSDKYCLGNWQIRDCTEDWTVDRDWTLRERAERECFRRPHHWWQDQRIPLDRCYHCTFQRVSDQSRWKQSQSFSHHQSLLESISPRHYHWCRQIRQYILSQESLVRRRWCYRCVWHARWLGGKFWWRLWRRWKWTTERIDWNVTPPWWQEFARNRRNVNNESV